MGKKCLSCQVIKYHRSGWAIKSPPKAKWKRNHQFHRRWLVLVTVKLCSKCKEIYALSENCLMLLYYTDDKEQNLKGMFKVEDAYIQNVDHIDDAPTKELAEKTCIMLWRLPSHNNRTLYLIFKDKPDQQSWVFAFQNYMQEKKKQKDPTGIDDKEIEEFVQKKVEKYEPVQESTIEKEMTLLRNARKISGCSQSGNFQN